MIISQTLIQGNGKRNQIVQQMNQINAIDISNDSLKIQMNQNQQKKSVESKKINKKEKRKVRFQNNTKIYQFSDKDEATDKVQFLEKWAKGQEDEREIVSAKRTRHNDDSYE